MSDMLATEATSPGAYASREHMHKEHRMLHDCAAGFPHAKSCKLRFGLGIIGDSDLRRV